MEKEQIEKLKTNETKIPEKEPPGTKGQKAEAYSLGRPLAAIVLAAGESKRMGRQKLLLPFGAENVIAKTLNNLRQAGICPIYLVVGYKKQELLNSINTEGLRIIENSQYQTGQSSSVKAGIKAIPRGYGAMFVLGDQPLIPPSLYKEIADAYKKGLAPIVLPEDNKGKRGNPAVFAPELFEEIMALRGDTGPRGLLEKYKESSQAVISDEAGIFLDLDTFAAYEECLKEAGLK